MTDKDKHGDIVTDCHLCGAPARAGTTCPYCGAVNLSPNPNAQGDQIMPSTGNGLHGEQVTCSWCYNPAPKGDWCPHCGTLNRPGSPQGSGPSPWSRYSLRGCIFETNKRPAPTLNTPKLRLPDRVDLRMNCPPVENQLRTNSCVANAVVGALEYHQKKAGLALTDLSRLFVYYNARSLSNSEAQDGGSYIHHGMAAVLAYGACEATVWPFEEGSVTARPSDNCYQNARQYDAVQYARTPRGESAMTALAQGLPIVFGIFVPGDYYDAAAQTGVMPRPDQVTPVQPPSGHAMLIVGYDTSDRTYLVRNSWSSQWADGGYCRIPFETMEAWSDPEDFWTIGAIEQASGFKLTGPSMVDAMKGLGVDTERLSIGGQSMGRLRSDLRSRLSSDLESAKRDFRDRLRDKKT
ncbi:MAG: C1 family peptidase [Pseudomonadota bacterium]